MSDPVISEMDAGDDLARRKKRTARQMVGVALLMGALAWASVPFYDWFCRVTGFGGHTAGGRTGRGRGAGSNR